MFFISKIYNKKDLHKKIFQIEDYIFYLGNSSIKKYTLEDSGINYNTTKWLYTIVEDGCMYSKYIILLTWDSLVVLNKDLEIIYRYDLEDRYTKIKVYNYLIVLYSTSKILLLHILDQKKIIFNYPIQYDFEDPILDIEFISNNLYVLSKEKITTLEYSGQFLEFISVESHRDGYKLEQVDGNLLIITEQGVMNLSTGELKPILKVFCTKRFDNKLFLLDESGVIYDLKGNIHFNINPSKDFLFTGELILTVGCCGDNFVYNGGTKVSSIEGGRVYKEGKIYKDKVMLSDGVNEKVVKLRIEADPIEDEDLIYDLLNDCNKDCKKDISKDHLVCQQNCNVFEFKNYIFHILKDNDTIKNTVMKEENREFIISKKFIFYLTKANVTIKSKNKVIKEYNVEYYDYHCMENGLILVSSKEVLFITGLGKFPVKTSSQKVVFTPFWVICYSGMFVKFINIQERRLEYFQLLKFEVRRIFYHRNVLVYSGDSECCLSTLFGSPTPPVVVRERIIYFDNGFIATTRRLIDLDEDVSYDLSLSCKSLRRVVRQDKKYLVVDESKVYEIGIKEVNITNADIKSDMVSDVIENELNNDPIDNPLSNKMTNPKSNTMTKTITNTMNNPISNVEDNVILVKFTNSSVLIFKDDTLSYEYPLGDFYCSEVKDLVYVGFSDFLLVYKIGKKSLLKKYRILLENKPLAIRVYEDLVYISILHHGLVVYRGKELVSKDYLSRTISDFLVVGDKVYGSSPSGYLYIYSSTLDPLGCIFIGKILSFYFDEKLCKLYFLTELGEVGELVETSDDMKDGDMKDSDDYFEMYNRKRVINITLNIHDFYKMLLQL